MSLPSGCDQCRKTSLSLLLLRPSPIAHARALRTDNVNSIISTPALAKGLLPARLPTDSRVVLRLLRAGYVHVYLPKPPRALRRNWLTFRVTDDADLISEDRPMFSQPNANVQCVRKDHNRAGTKVLTIPEAHEISEIWIAFSANLWNPTIRARNAANPAVMQRIALTGNSDNTFLPTVEALESQVLECKLTKRGAYGWEKPAFPYHELFRNGGAQELADYLAQVARAHPKTHGKERAVVLADPVGFAAELNHLRRQRYALLCRELKRPEHQHALQSASAIDGLRTSIERTNEHVAVTKVSQRLTKQEFDSRSWPAGTEWFELDSESKAMLPKERIPINRSGTYIEHTMQNADRMGMVRYPDHEERASRWAKAKSEEMWSDFAPYIDQEARTRWFSAFSAMLKEKHEESLDRLELDWSAACNDEKTIDYFVNHFDATDPNDARASHSPGAAYSRENALMRTPEPYTKGPALDAYIAQLDADITDARSVMLRSIVCNQQDFIAAVHQQLTADPGEGMRDKVYDILKDLKVSKNTAGLPMA